MKIPESFIQFDLYIEQPTKPRAGTIQHPENQRNNNQFSTKTYENIG